MSDETSPSNKRLRPRRWFLWAALPLLVAVAWCTVPRALAFGPWHGRHETAKSADELRSRMQDRLEFVLDRLEATDAQRTEIRTIVANAAPEMFAIAQEGRSLRAEVKESLASATIDKARLERAHQALNVLTARATDSGTRALLAVAETLTPEQRKQISEHFARMHGEP